MRTADDVREAFAAFADRAPTEVHVTVAEPAARPRSWRPVAATCVAVAAVVAAVAALAVVIAPHRRAMPAGVPPDRVPMRFSFTVDPASGYDVFLGGIEAASGWAYFKDGSDTGTVNVYGPGRYDPTEAKKGAAVEVNGHRGYFGDVDGVGNSVAWQYAHDAWVVVTDKESASAATARRAELAFAKALRFDPRPLRVPFRVGYLPPSLALTSGNEQIGSLSEGRELSFSDAAHDDALRVDAGVEGDWFAHCERVVIHGYPGCFGSPDPASDHERALRLKVPGGWLTIDRFSSAYSDAELRKIAESMTLAPIDQPSTWFDADTAVPR